MKKIVITLSLAAAMFSCDTIKNASGADFSSATELLSSLDSNSTVQQIKSLFGMLDTDANEAISSSEAIGSVSENFDALDTDGNSSLNLTELEGLLALLK